MGSTTSSLSSAGTTRHVAVAGSRSESEQAASRPRRPRRKMWAYFMGGGGLGVCLCGGGLQVGMGWKNADKQAGCPGHCLSIDI